MENASRVITYVGVLGYRMDGYSLVDMRVHDINVVTDLNEHDPNSATPPPTQDPNASEEQIVTDNDGTASGTQFDSSYITVDALFAYGVSYFETGWLSQWWPTVYLKVLSYSKETLLHIAIDLLGGFDLVSCTIFDFYLEMAGIEQGISWFEAWVSAGLFPEVVGLFGITMGAWMAADGLKASGTGWIAAAAVATGLWATFIGINIGYVYAGFQLSFDDEWARNIYIGTLVAILALVLGLKTVEKHLTSLGANLVVSILTKLGRAPSSGWNPVISTMTNVFRIMTIAIFSVLVWYHQGRIMGWW